MACQKRMPECRQTSKSWKAVGPESRDDTRSTLHHGRDNEPDDVHERAHVCIVSRRKSKRHIAVSRQSRHEAAVSQPESSGLHLSFVLAFAYLVALRGIELILSLASPRRTSLPASATTSTESCTTCRAQCKCPTVCKVSPKRAAVASLWEATRQRYIFGLKLHL